MRSYKRVSLTVCQLVRRTQVEFLRNATFRLISALIPNKRAETNTEAVRMYASVV